MGGKIETPITAVPEPDDEQPVVRAAQTQS